MNQRLINMIPGVEAEEMLYLDHITKDLTDEQLRTFISMYSSKRKPSDTILICTILGFVVVAGVQRFMLGQVGMGLLYLFTGGLCLIGTIVDLVNYKKMTLEYNQKMAAESMALLGR
ncbi:MAG TPA: TM2 domain-containing protein [Chitinophagaceae bacterium]|nr:TM2 domain-containing protein [Chitinophagaceae bacterium]